MNTIKNFAFTALLVPCILLAQRPDFSLDRLYPVAAATDRSEGYPASASVQVFCNGSAVTFVIQVFDSHINLDPSPVYTDHVQLWLALPASSYPANFEFASHSDYVYYPDYMRSHASPRFFSIYPEYAREVDIQRFVHGFDYPPDQSITQERLGVPLTRYLRQEAVHYGIVQYGIYPNRAPRLLNREHHRAIEQVLRQPMADLTAALRYSVEQDRGSYTINVEITPESLGFVSLPELAELRFMVDIMDTGSGGRARTAFSTAQNGVPGRPVTFNSVRFARPMRTNMTPVPDVFFRNTSYHPVMMRGAQGWIPTSVDTDALVYKERTASQALLEVKFFEQPYEYSSIDRQGISLHKLKTNYDFVNAVAEEREYLLLNDQLFSATRMRNSISPLDTLTSRFFRFPDGSSGLLIKENAPMDPYGWGNTGHLIEETIRIHRVTENRRQDILYIRQGEGQRPYCLIQGRDFPGYYVSKLDWIRKGEILVLILIEWDSGRLKRVKVSWGNDGSNVRVEAVD
mgnify:CR=1 FL=1